MKIIETGIPEATDYFGVLWTMAGIDDAVIVEHGAPGTITYTQIGFNSLNRRSMYQKIFTSAVNENDIVMGSDSRLAEAVKWVDKTYHPPVIAVVATAITAVIGLDIDGFVDSIQPEISAKLIPFPSGGFNGTYFTGIEESCKKLIQRYLTDSIYDPEERTVNILGPTCEQFNTISDVAELKRLLSLMDITVKTCFPDGSDVSAIKQIPRAEVNLLTRDVMIPVGSLITEINGQPSLYGLPMGISGTVSWLKDISKALNVSFPVSVISDEINRWGFSLSQLFSKIQPYKHLSLVIACPYEYAYGLSHLAIKDWGLMVQAVILPDIPNTTGYEEALKTVGVGKVLIAPSDEEFLDLINLSKPQVMFANTYYLKIGRNIPVKIHASHPTPDIISLYDGTPYVGFKGYAYLTQRLVNEIQAHPEVFRI